MAQSSLEAEFNKVASEAAERIRSDDNSVCIIYHIKDNDRVSLDNLKEAVDDCRGNRKITKSELKRNLEFLASLGVINMYLNNTYDLSNIGKKVFPSLPIDRFARTQ